MRIHRTVLLVLSITLAATMSMVAACEDDDDIFGIEDPDFEAASLTGAAERPDPVTTDATGDALFEIDGTTVRFQVRVEDIENVTLAHIHVGGVDVPGPIVVELFNAGGNPETFTDREVLASGTFTDADVEDADGITSLDDLLEAMEAGNTYVNVHTTANPPGEIRGQIDEF